jgi:hypothetical protein
VSLRRVIDVASDVYLLARCTHRQDDIGHDLGMTSGANNENAHGWINFP